MIRTGDFEVVHASPAPTKRRSDRPVFQPQVDDEDKTLLFSGSPRTMLPPRTAAPVPMPAIAKPARAPNNMSLRGLTRGADPKPQDMRGAVRRQADAEDRTILRPTSTLPPALQKPASAAPPAAPMPKPVSARPPAMMPTPYMPLKPSAPPPAIAVNAPGGSDAKRLSEPPGDPPSSVITAKTRIVRARSSMSWAAGLMAIGAFVGLVTAVIARGDADAVLDAAASVVDPSHTSTVHANAAAAQAAVLPSFVDTGAKKVGTDQNPAPGACLTGNGTSVSAPVVVNTPPPPAPALAPARTAEVKVASIAGSDPKEAARPTPPKPAPVAYAAPARRAWHPAAPPPAPVERSESSSPSSGWLANVTPPNAGAPIARPSRASKGGGADNFESAAAADALAKAQLEASLR